jgi:RNA polymerase sigma-70 factor (ECF subfamily)
MQRFNQGDAEQNLALSPVSSHVNEVDDETLMKAITVGQVWAMEALYLRYNSMLYSLAYRMVADQPVAEDVLQESFLAVWRRADTYSPKLGAVRSWLVSIVHHRAIDHLRRVRRRAAFKGSTLDEVDRNGNMASPDVWEVVWRSVQDAQVREAVKKLPPRQRVVIELAYFHGLTYAEIARTCQLPLGTVKARMRFGLMRLRLLLDQKNA